MSSEGLDASGNVKAGDVGKFIKTELEDGAKLIKLDLTVKYIDPTYMIRSVPANPQDRNMCGYKHNILC